MQCSSRYILHTRRKRCTYTTPSYSYFKKKLKTEIQFVDIRRTKTVTKLTKADKVLGTKYNKLFKNVCKETKLCTWNRCADSIPRKKGRASSKKHAEWGAILIKSFLNEPMLDLDMLVPQGREVQVSPPRPPRDADPPRILPAPSHHPEREWWWQQGLWWPPLANRRTRGSGGRLSQDWITLPRDLPSSFPSLWRFFVYAHVLVCMLFVMLIEYIKTQTSANIDE